jgi:hypothetical protein
MKKIIALSDTHMSTWNPPESLSDSIEKSDIVTHSGDFTSYKSYKDLSKICELKAVHGNSDDDRIKRELPETDTFRVEKLNFGIVHQGNYLTRFDDLAYKALELDVDVLIFGHIHRFVVEKIGKVVLICPGSPTKPRLSIASCAEITVNGSRLDVEMKIVQNIFCGTNVFGCMKKQVG